MRRIILVIFVAFVPLVCEAQARTITDNEARAAALAFIEALADENVAEVRDISDLPFLAGDDRLLESDEEFADYFGEALAVARPNALPQQVLRVRDYQGTRNRTNPGKLELRDKVLRAGDVMVVVSRARERGVIMLGDRAGRIAVIGFGNCEGDGLC